MGGLRLRTYDRLSFALDDALRPSRAMSVKNARAGLTAEDAGTTPLDLDQIAAVTKRDIADATNTTVPARVEALA